MRPQPETTVGAGAGSSEPVLNPSPAWGFSDNSGREADPGCLPDALGTFIILE